MAAAVVAVLLSGVNCPALAQTTSYRLVNWAGAEHANVDGPRTSARFDWPMGLVMDREDNLYVADSRNHTVRRVSSDGMVTTLAGKPGVGGRRDGFGSGARLGEPAILGIDPEGNVYVASDRGHSVQSVTPNGVVKTVVPPEELGSAMLLSLAVDSAKNLYLGFEYPQIVRKRAPDGKTTAWAGQTSSEIGTAYPSSCLAYALATQVDDYLYITNGSEVMKISPVGVATAVGRGVSLSQSSGLAIDPTGNLYVADTYNSAVRKITAAGVGSVVAGGLYQWGYVDGTGTAARFEMPWGIALDRSGNLFVSEPTLNLIRKITPEGSVTTYAGQRVRSEDGDPSVVLFEWPVALAADPGGNLYVADSTTGAVRKIDPQRRVTTFAGSPGSWGTADGLKETARFGRPAGIAVDGAGNVYVSDRIAYTIRKITPAGLVTTLAGTALSQGTVDGIGAAARFVSPDRLTIDQAGNLYVADSLAIRKIAPDGTVSLLAGAAGQTGYKDAQDAAARFSVINGLAVDGSGNVYVAEIDTIRKISPTGVVTTFIGKRGDFANVDGPGASARFANLQDLTISSTGEVYVLATGAIRKIATDATVTTVMNFEGTIGQMGIAMDRAGDIYVTDASTRTVRKMVTVGAAPTITSKPQSQTSPAGGNIVITVAASAVTNPTFQWRHNGDAVRGVTAAALTLTDLQLKDVGLYTAVVSSGASEAVTSAAIVGLTASGKVTGAGREVGSDIFVAKNGNTFDQVLLTGSEASVLADYQQITRMSFVDLDDDIVQVEFSGPGTLSLVLENAGGPAGPVNYNQDTKYMKGHAGIVIAGATEATNVAVFSVGKATAVNQGLFKDGVKYDGIADLAFIAILSSNGKFGGVRTANANYFAAKGLTGLYAPGVAFQGPVFIGNITAFDAATPVIQLGAVADARITGGDLAQGNGAAVEVSGLTQLKFTPGGDSHGNALPAQANKAVLKQDGVDVTAQIVVNP